MEESTTKKLCPATQGYTDCKTCQMYENGACMIKQALSGLRMLGNLSQLNKLHKLDHSLDRLNEYEKISLKLLSDIQKDLGSLEIRSK